jgi:NADH dehydrogenase
MKLAITGATGYIGSSLVSCALERGHEVFALTRRPPAHSNVKWIPFDLSENLEIHIPADVTAVVHLATMVNDGRGNIEREAEATQKLIHAARNIGAQFLFVSSQTARAEAPTDYGRMKWKIEQDTLAAGGWIVRPGQVYGGEERALFGLLVDKVRRFAFIPALWPPPKIQPVHVLDLAAALLSGLETGSYEGQIFCIGKQVPIEFSRFLSLIARERLHRCRIFLPVPTALIRFGAFLLRERMSTRLGIYRLMSLLNLPTMDTSADMQQLGISLRPLANGLTRSGSGRGRLIREGYALLRYVLRAKPESDLVRRYTRCIEGVRDGRALSLPEFVLRFSPLLALLDDNSWLSRIKGGKEFAWRLNAAIVLAEASPQGSRRFLRVSESAGFWVDSARMTWAVFNEAMWRVLGLCIRPTLSTNMFGTLDE